MLFKLDFKKCAYRIYTPGAERVNAKSQHILHGKLTLAYILCIHQKLYKLNEGIMLFFVSGKKIGHHFWRRVYVKPDNMTTSSSTSYGNVVKMTIFLFQSNILTWTCCNVSGRGRDLIPQRTAVCIWTNMSRLSIRIYTTAQRVVARGGHDGFVTVKWTHWWRPLLIAFLNCSQPAWRTICKVRIKWIWLTHRRLK